MEIVCYACKHFIVSTGGCNIYKAKKKYIKTGKCHEFEVR